MPDLVDLRELLYERPSRRAWQDLCTMLDRFELDERNEIAIPYCRQHLEQTPAWTKLRRQAPKPWVDAFIEGFEVTPQLALVSHLDLSYQNEKRDEIIDFVSDISSFVMLRKLVLNGLNLRDEDAKKIAEASHMAQLQSLHLESNKLSAEGIFYLANSEHFGQLQELNLCDNSLGDEGAFAIANSTHLPALRYLNLSRCDINEEGKGAQAIADSPHLPNSVKSNWAY